MGEKQSGKLVGIIRVSSKEQADEQRAGIARQRAAIEAISRTTGYPLDKLITISDVSGSDLSATTEWRDEIVPRLRGGCHLAIDAIDRIARPDKFDFSVLATVQQVGTMIYTPGGKVDLTRPEGFLLGGIGALFGGVEKMAIKRRIFEAREAKRRRGEFVQAEICLPLGITYDRKARRWGYTDERSKVERAFRMLVHEGVENYAEIGRQIGITLAGAKVVLRNPIYRGWAIYTQRSGTESYAQKNGRQATKKKIDRAPDEIIKVQVFGLDGQEAQMIDDATWQRAQELLAEKRDLAVRRRAKVKPRIYYSGFLLSAKPKHRDRRAHRLYGKPNTHLDYYVCRCRETHSPSKPESCGLRGLPVPDTNAALDARLADMTANPYFVKHAIESARKRRDEHVGDVGEIERQHKGVAVKLERLLALHLDGKVSRASYDATYTRLQGELEGLRVRIDQAHAAQGQFDETDIREHLRGVQFDPAWTPEKKKAWLAKYISFVMVSERGPEMYGLRLPSGEYIESDWTDTWADLLGYDMFDGPALTVRKREAVGYYSAAHLAGLLSMTTKNLQYRLRTGELPEPAHKIGLKRMWTHAEIDEAVKVWKARK